MDDNVSMFLGERQGHILLIELSHAVLALII
jgi:hypothetical protein